MHSSSITTVASGLLLLLPFGGLAVGAPTPDQPQLAPRAASAAAIIAQIMPSSNTCAGAQFADECRTADQAAPFLIAAMQQYGVYAPGEIAGVLSLVGYESVDMKFKHNVSPGRPGQGTSNMQQIQYNTKYAASIPALAAGLAAAGTSSPDAVLALVTPDQYNFGSAPWFLATQCPAATRAALAAGTGAGFQAYTQCVGVDAAGDRLAYWTRAKAAFGLSG